MQNEIKKYEANEVNIVIEENPNTVSLGFEISIEDAEALDVTELEGSKEPYLYTETEIEPEEEQEERQDEEEQEQPQMNMPGGAGENGSDEGAEESEKGEPDESNNNQQSSNSKPGGNPLGQGTMSGDEKVRNAVDEMEKFAKSLSNLQTVDDVKDALKVLAQMAQELKEDITSGPGRIGKKSEMTVADTIYSTFIHEMHNGMDEGHAIEATAEDLNTTLSKVKQTVQNFNSNPQRAEKALQLNAMKQIQEWLDKLNIFYANSTNFCVKADESDIESDETIEDKFNRLN